MTESLSTRMLKKCKEAFIMGLEIYNKPTIQYRIEGFSFFICNAWELMLKAYLIDTKGEKSIYFKDNPNRTISLEKCIEIVFTNNKDPLRVNLERIVTLRNTSTHFITEDYERLYAPLFQSCVINFTNKLLEFHDEDITTMIPQNFLTLSVNLHDLTDEQVRAKYTPELAERLIIERNEIEVLKENSNHKFAITIQQNLYITKKEDKADFKVSVSREANAKGHIIKELRNPNDTHRYSFKLLLEEINGQLANRKINFSHSNGESKRETFNTSDLTEFIKFYNLKSEERYAFKHMIGESERYSYSLEAANFIVDQIKQKPNTIINEIKKANKKR